MQGEQEMLAIAPSATQVKDFQEQGEQRHQAKRGVRRVMEKAVHHEFLFLGRGQLLKVLPLARQRGCLAQNADLHRRRLVFRNLTGTVGAYLGLLVVDGEEYVGAAELEEGKEQDAEAQVDAQRLHITHAASREVLSAQCARTKQQQGQGAPELAFERHIMRDKLMQKFARAGHVQGCRLATGAAEVAWRVGIAVMAGIGGTRAG